MKLFLVPILGVALSGLLTAVPIGDIGQGVLAKEGAAGKGYILFSPSSLFSRTGISSRFILHNGNEASNFAAVYYTGGQWYYYSNETAIPFTPEATDVLVATVNFGADSPAVMLEGANTVTNGVVTGYIAGDINVLVNQFNGVANPGEFAISGTDITLNPVPDELQVDPPPVSTVDATDPRAVFVGNLGQGILGQDGAQGTGYIMFSHANVSTRFGLAASQADHFVPVFYADGQWYHHFKNGDPLAFTPDPTDLLVASVDYTADRKTVMLKGSNYSTHGIATGYLDGDIVVKTNRYNNVFNRGEFGVSGTFFIPNNTSLQLEATPLVDLNSGVAAKETATGEGYIMMSQSDVRDRFQLSLSAHTAQFIAVFYENNQWYYYDNETAVAFAPEQSDVLVASVDYANDTKAVLLKGTLGKVNGITSGYLDGNIEVLVNHYGNQVNLAEFQIRGSDIVFHPASAEWWSNMISTDQSSNNLGVASIGQAKWISSSAYQAIEAIGLEPSFTLESIVPAVPSSPDAAWYEEQKKVLNIGQLKFLAAPFYEELGRLAPQWVETQMQLNGIPWTSGQVYPWDESTPVEDNFKLANIGQLKSVFGLRFNYDSDEDGNLDLEEYILINRNPNDEFETLEDVITITNGGDDDGDGLGYYDEIALGLDPNNPDFDDDGLLDGNEIRLGHNPKSQDHPAVELSVY